MKQPLFVFSLAVMVGGLLLGSGPRASAGTFTVNTLSDSHAVNPASSANDSTGHISLRSAIEAANAQAGAATVNVPAGTFNLSLGELDVAPNGSATNNIIGLGPASTIVSQIDGSNRVFNIDSNSLGSAVLTLSGLAIQGGHDGADLLGGAGLLAGSITSPNKDSLTLNNCVVQDNHCQTTNTREPGGGLQMAGGNLTLSGCIFSNNTSGQSLGGAVFVLAQSVISPLTVSNCVFINNRMTNNSGAGPDGGGAIMIETPTGSVHSITASTFSGNQTVGTSGDTYGGAVELNGGTLNIANSTFVGNSATGQGGLGGALYVDSGTVNMIFCRLVGNTAPNGGGAVYNHGSNRANTSATNNWWGCNGGPGLPGCDVVSSDGGTMSFNPWITITASASPGTIGLGQSSTVTASVLQNSSGQTLTVAQEAVLIGLPLSWSAVHGGISGAQTTVQANGQATATFNNDNTCNSGSVVVTLDNAAVTNNIVVLCPDLTLGKTDNVSGTVPLGGSWTWTLHVANTGSSPATFTNGSTILLDNLPNANIVYGSPSIANVSGVSGTLAPTVDGSANLSVTASGAVTLSAGGSFDALLSATPNALGLFANPRTGGVCAVDPNNELQELSKANNTGSDGVTVTCPAIVGTVGGGGAICPGNSTIISVTLSGGRPPYSVTLNNGGGTQAGGSPLFFTVSPTATTTYQVSSGTDALGCAVNNSGSATVTVNSAINPTITLAPASVFANSAGNQAIASAGFSSYEWTISNGLITGPNNQPTVTYVAGVSNSVTLSLTVVNGLGCISSASVSAPIITGFSVHTNVTFTDALTVTSIGMAFDGTNYWSCSGGGSTGVRLAQYTSKGALVSTYSPGLDFRSVFTRTDGTLLARAFNDSTIYQQTSPGVFARSGVSLTGGTLNSQSSVVLNGVGTEYDAMSGGVVSRWATNGAYLGSVNLAGFGSVSGENTNPQNRGLGAFGNLWLTYNGADVLSIWDTSGNRLVEAALPGAGTNFDSDFGFSFCNGKVFIVDVAGGLWRGFDLYGGAAAAVLYAELNASWNTDVMNKILALGSIPRVDLISVDSANPSAAQLRSYQSLMVFSDYSFGDATGLGNLLADYIDQGGGVVLQTFVFATNTAYSIGGRVSTGGYLPFSLATETAAGSQTMVEDLPLHPMLDGVSSFNGGTSSYQNTPITIASGATQVAHWSNGQPLAGAKDDPPGRNAGLNFFPPSSDVRNDFWVASTDGAKLMANALLWAGRIPPNVLAAPADQVRAVGSTATFTVVAAGTSPLRYQWRLNGANLPQATNSVLSFVVQTNSGGSYSVVVSNLYGATTTLGAALDPALRFLTPEPSGGAFSLFLVSDDGSAVAPSRASRVGVYSSTNAALPFVDWTLLTNSVVPTNGQLRIDGFSVTNAAARFFRAAEAP